MKNYLKENLEILKQMNPNLVNWIKKQKQPNWYIPAESNFLIKNASKILPAYLEKNQTAAFKKEVKKYEFLKEEITFFIGIGHGYLLNNVLEQKEKKHHIVVAESVGFLLKKSLELNDYTKWIKDGTLLFASPGKEEIAAVVTILETKLVTQKWQLLSEKYIMLRPEDYHDIAAYTIDIINQIQCSTGTVMGAGDIIAENDIINLPYVIRHRGISELRNLFKNKPIIVVSTGPSLQKNIHLLRGDAQKKVIIIAVAQALRVLLAYDITPDFICTVDYGKTNIEHFEGLMDSKVPLIALNRSYAPILKRWKGTKFISTSENSPAFKDTAVGLLYEKGSVEQGGSVSHFCLGNAINMGGNPIVLIGQDLAYVGEDSHIPLVDAGGKVKIKPDGSIDWEVKDPRSHLKEETHKMGYAKEVDGYFGQPVLTNIGLASFITGFETIIRGYPKITFINATEGGAKIKGMKQMSLKRVLEKYSINSINPIIPSGLVDNNTDLIKKAIPLLEKEKKDLKKIISSSELGIKVVNEMRITTNKNKLKELLAENEKHSLEAEKLSKQNPLMGLHIYSASRKIHSRELSVENSKVESLLKKKKDLSTRLDRNLLILEAAKKSAERLKKLYSKTIDKLKKYLITKDESLLINTSPEIISWEKTKRDAEKYLKAGNWAHPLLEIRKIRGVEQARENFTIINFNSKYSTILNKAISMKLKAIFKAKTAEDNSNFIEYLELIEESRIAGKDNKDFGKALRLLKKASKLMPDKIEAKWGIATTLNHIGKYETSILKYKELAKEYPDNTRFEFEMGQVMLNTDPIEAVKVLEKVLEKTPQFQSFYFRLGEFYLKLFGDPKQAKVCLEKYLELFPHNAKAWEYLARCFDKLFLPIQAQIARNKAIKL